MQTVAQKGLFAHLPYFKQDYPDSGYYKIL